jgi:hypothetical protein
LFDRSVEVFEDGPNLLAPIRLVFRPRLWYTPCGSILPFEPNLRRARDMRMHAWMAAALLVLVAPPAWAVPRVVAVEEFTNVA